MNVKIPTGVILALFVLGVLLWLTAGCGLPVTKSGFQQNLAHGLGPFHGRLDAQHQQIVELQGEIAGMWASLGQVAKGQQTIAEWATQTTDRLVQLERAGKITQRDLGLARSAIDKLKQQMAGAHSETLKKVEEEGGFTRTAVVQDGADTRSLVTNEAVDTRNLVADVGRKVDSAAADAATAHTALDQKVDRRVDEVVGAVAGVGVKVDATKTVAETAASRAGDARDEAVKATAAAESAKAEAQIAGNKADAAGSKADAAGSKAEAAVAKAGADVVVEVGKVRKELSDHAAETAKNRAGIIAELNRLITRPLP